MKATQSSAVKMRPVNLTLNEDVVVQACKLTNNLSALVESLLSDYLEHKHRQQLANAKTKKATVAMWNNFNSMRGSFSDENSTL